jgi:hypothetical protein
LPEVTTARDSVATATATPDARRHSISQSQRTAAKVVGFAFAATDIIAIFAQFYVRARLVLPGDAVKTAANIATAESVFRFGIVIQLVTIAGLVVLIVALYVLLRPVSPGLTLLAAAWRLIEQAVLAVGTVSSFDALQLLSGSSYLRPVGSAQLQAFALRAIGAYDDAYSVSLFFAGIGSALFALVFLQSRFIPRPLAVWGIFGALLTAASTLAFTMLPGLSDVASPWVFVPLLIFELGTALWLVIRGLPKSPTYSAVDA